MSIKSDLDTLRFFTSKLENSQTYTPDLCFCGCHTDVGIHIQPCCAGECKHCGQNINFGFEDKHFDYCPHKVEKQTGWENPKPLEPLDLTISDVKFNNMSSREDIDFDEAFKRLTELEQQRVIVDQVCFGQAMIFIGEDGTIRHIPPEDWADHVEG